LVSQEWLDFYDGEALAATLGRAMHLEMLAVDGFAEHAVLGLETNSGSWSSAYDLVEP